MAKTTFVSPVYSGAYSRAVNRDAAGVLSRKKKKEKKKKLKTARNAAPRQVRQQNHLVQKSVGEQDNRPRSEVPPPGPQSPHLPQSRAKPIVAGNAMTCVYCSERMDNVADHVRKVHGTEKYVRWLLSRCETPRSMR